MKRLITLLLTTTLVWGANAQQRPIQSLYMFDPLLINPAYAGTHVQLSATAIYRNQWVNFDGAPKTVTGSVHSGFRKARVGLGLLFGNDQIGVHSDNSFYFMYSYKIPLSKRKENTSVLSMGVQGGFNSLKSNYNLTNPRDLPEIGAVSKFNPNFGTGIFFRNKNLYAGFSVPYILDNKILGIYDTEFGLITPSGRQQRYYYLNAGLSRKLSTNVKWAPSTLVRIQENAPLSFDINTMIILYDIVSFGGSYRNGGSWSPTRADAFIGLFELQINENFHVGYAYDITTSDIRLYSNGTHEIMINYRIKIPRLHKGLECPSYW